MPVGCSLGVRRVASVIAGAFVLHGCVTYPVEPVVPATDGPRGVISVRPGRPGLVIAAPHGTSDPRTGEMAAELARRTGFGLVVASGFSVELDGQTAMGRRFQVNRPFEGVPGRPASDEVATEEARQVYETYEQRVREAARGRLTFYAEIHGNNRRDAADRIEIATVGVNQDEARRLRALLELCRDATLRGHPEAPRLEVRVEPADPIVDAASSAKRAGILRLPDRGLHIELPRVARREWGEVDTAVLADVIAQAATLPRPP